MVGPYEMEYPDNDGPRFVEDIFYKGEYDQALANWNVLDIGAHIGLFSLRVYPFAKHIWAVEPDPINFQCLVNNIAQNKLNNITPINAALWNKTGTQMFNSRGSSGSGHISDRGDIEVKTYTLNDLVDEYKIPKLDLIKSDTEGAENTIFYQTSSARILGWASVVVCEHATSDTSDFFRALGFSTVAEGVITVWKK